MKRLRIKAVLLSLLVVIGCSSSDEQPQPFDPQLRGLEFSEMQEALHGFGVDVFRKVVEIEDKPENMILSPLSIVVALYMTYNGADGDTRAAMAKTLNFNDVHADSLNDVYLALFNRLQPQNDSVNIELANAVFWDKNRMSPSEELKQALQSHYDCALRAEDFEFDPEGTLEKINAWVYDKTEGKIDKIIENLDPQEIMFLINALYFIGSWDDPFDPQQTFPRNFMLSNGSEVSTEFMFQDNILSTYLGEDFQAFEGSFTDTNYAMYFILPPEKISIDAFINTFDFKSFFDQDEAFVDRRVYLSIPKFELSYKITLNEVLKSLGMDIAFDRNRADFSRLGEVAYGNPYISRVEHKTYLKVDEKGVEGAAVTAVGIATTSLPPQLTFDRPFMVILMHKETDMPIFIGKIENPKED